MSFELDETTDRFIREHRVARLATSDLVGQPAVVPICYAFEGDRFYVALDEKPKSVPDHELKRVRNIRANPRVAIVIDHYSEDWSELVYVLITGTAEIISSCMSLPNAPIPSSPTNCSRDMRACCNMFISIVY